MTDVDFPTFDRALRRLALNLRLRCKPAELDELSRSYFKILEAAPLDDVLTAAKRWQESARTFPKPVDWLGLLPNGGPASAPDGIRVLAASELDAYEAAERKHWHDEPCSCLDCVTAGVSDRPLRFTVDRWEDGRDVDAWDPRRHRVVHPGHWAHGEELARHYRAYDAFKAQMDRYPTLKPLVRSLLPIEARIEKIFTKPPSAREPGEEG